MDLKIKQNKDNIVIFFNDEVLATVNRETLNSLANPPKKIRPKSNLENKLLLIVKEYKLAWEKYYSTKLKTEYKHGTADYFNFKKAAQICIAHDVKARVFIKAQIDGMRFVNGGIFPKPSQLCTPNAETRLLQFMKDASMVDVPELTWEKETPLEKNRKYVEIKQKIKSNDATLKEAHYALECELARRGQASIETKAYIAVMEENAKQN